MAKTLFKASIKNSKLPLQANPVYYQPYTTRFMPKNNEFNLKKKIPFDPEKTFKTIISS